MRIGVDFHVLQGINQGSKTYLSNIYSSPEFWSPEMEMICYFDRSSELPKDIFKNQKNIRTSDSRVRRLMWEFALASRRDKLDFFHSQYIMPEFLSCKSVVTIHDILFEKYPQYFSRSFVARSRFLVRRAAKRASIILTVSEFSKKEISTYYSIDPARIFVVPNGVNVHDFEFDRGHALDYVREKYKISNFILTVGRLEPRKNHLGMLEAFNIARHNFPKDLKFVIVGQRDFEFNDIYEYVEKKQLFDSVVFIDDANALDLTRLYKAAKLFIYTSFAEGFGIPPLEAMAAGTPVICSRGTAMTELFSGAAFLVNPFDIGDISKALCDLYFSADRMNELIMQGSDLSLKFSWDNSARALKSIYRKEFRK